MLDEPAAQKKSNVDDAENTQPAALQFLNAGGDGLKNSHHHVGKTTTTAAAAARQAALKKKGGKKLRQATATCCPPRLQHLHHHHHHHNHHHHHPNQHHTHSVQAARSARNHHHPPHSNHNNNNSNNNNVSGGTVIATLSGARANTVLSSSSRTSTVLLQQTNAEPAQPAAAHHLIKFGGNNKKEQLLKSKGVRCERVVTPPGVKHDLISQNRNSRSHRSKHGTTAPSSAHSVKRKDAGNPQKIPCPAPKTPLHSADNVKIEEVSPAGHVQQEEGEKIYAGAKFSEPPSPSVLPKPPSHWVGDNASQNGDQSREQMTVHLKSLLKVEGKA